METNLPSPDSVNRVLSQDTHGPRPGPFPDNPFVGLRPFKSDEGLLFFGRREQTLELLQQLQHSRFLSIVGSSGCGKSSLIRAGLIPKLQAGFLVEQRDQWRIATAKPGDAPLFNLAQSLVETFRDAPEATAVTTLVDNLRVSCSQAVVNFLRPRLNDSDTNLLLLIDQFEELFTFGRYGEKEIVETDDARDKSLQVAERLERERRHDEAADFVSIMLGLAQTDLPVYVVMTMRSDFLGDCDVFYGLPEAMNNNQYLVPRLIRPQRQEAIENPVLLYGKTISQRLLDRVLNDAGEEADQLPVMQHAMMRTWEKWQSTDDPGLDLKHYEAAGTMKQALSDDAEEALSAVSTEDLNLTKRLFQTLTDNDPRGRRIRRPTHLLEIEAITGSSRERLLGIISHFVSHDRSFLHLSQDQVDPLVDISHESLIRQWGRLRDWVTEESRYKDLYLRLVGMALRYYKPEPEDVLLRGPALQFALDWRQKRKPNQAWANRYHPALDQAFRFLDESKAQRDKDAAEAERRRNEEVERERREQAQLLAEQKQRAAEAEAAARKTELDQAHELARQREAATRWQRRTIFALGLLLIFAIATTVYAVRAGLRAEQRKIQAEKAERATAALSVELAGKVKELDASLQNEQALKIQIEKTLDAEKKLKDEAVKLRRRAEILAAHANQQARSATVSAEREKRASIELRLANAVAQKAALEAADNARKARQAEVKAIATLNADQIFREGLTLARTNNPKGAANKYREALEGYQSLPEPDGDGIATSYLELAEINLQSQDPNLFKDGFQMLDLAQETFEKIHSDNGSAAVSVRRGDFLVSDKILAGASDEEVSYYRALSSAMYRDAFDSYGKSKNLAGLVATSDKVANFYRTSHERPDLGPVLDMYEALLPYYTASGLEHERASLYLRIGEIRNRLNERDEANKNFDNALMVYRDSPDKEAEAKTYVDVGFVLGEEKDIKNYNEQGLRVVRTSQNPLAEANTLRYIGNRIQKRWSTGPASRPEYASEPKQAADFYTRALTLYQSLPETQINQADVLTDMGTLYLQTDKSAALDSFQKAYALYTDKEGAQKAALLFNIGAIQEEKGELDAALKSYKNAGALFGKEKSLDALRAVPAINRVLAAIAKKRERP